MTQAATQTRDPYHPDYGYPTELRKQALAVASAVGVSTAAKLFGVSVPAIYNWRRAYGAPVRSQTKTQFAAS